MKHPMPTTDLKGIFSVVGRRRTKAFAYGFALTFLACTAYIALSPSFGGTPSWLTNFLASSSSSSSADSYHSHLDSFLASADSYRSQFSSFISSLLPNSTTVSGLRSPEPTNSSASGTGSPRQSSGSSNRTKSGDADAASRNGSTTGSPTGEILGKNPATAGLISGSPPPPQGGRNETAGGPPVANETTQHAEVVPARSPPPAQVEQQQPPPASPPKVSNGGGSSSGPKWNIETMSKCNLFHGKWVRDESYPMYPPGSCTHIDESFDCSRNGRPDLSYQKLRWQPHGCYIPRLNATDMLERLRGKRLAFVGDSLNRNMWESLVCILRNAVKDKSKVFEVSGKRVFKTDTFYSFIFKDYNCTVEFFRSVFLVQEWEMVDTSGNEKETLRLDMISKSSSRYRDADVIVFNTGHWWTHEKTAKGKDYYQEGNRVYGELNVVEAFHKALNTWAKWVDANVDPRKTTVFFRGYSASHFRGGRWNSGGQCDAETEPIKNETYLARYPPKMDVLESVLRGMKAPVLYLNITRMTDYRKDAHPSTYRKPNLTEEQKKGYQDCSHWCLPGVPDSWNDLLYSLLLIRQHKPE